MISPSLARAVLLGLSLATSASSAQEPSPPPPPPSVPSAEPAPAAAAPQRYVSPKELERTGQLVPYEGGQIPPGAKLVSKPRSGMLTAGLVTLGVSYVPWFLIDVLTVVLVGRQLGAGIAVFAGLILAIPVLGPALTGIVSLGQQSQLGSTAVPTGVTLLIDAALQGLGIGLIAAAYGSPEQFVLQPAAPPPPKTSWMIVPGVQGVTGPTSGARFALAF